MSENTSVNTDGTTAVNTNPHAQEVPTDVLRDKLTAANNEAAQNRIKLREKTQEHTDALAQVQSLTDAKAAAETAKTAAELELNKVLAALEAGIPADKIPSAVKRLVGDTKDELLADAKELVTQLGISQSSPAVDPSQGHGSANAASNLSEGAQFLTRALGGSLTA